MANGKSREAMRKQRHERVRRKVSGSKEQPRMNVFRSLSEIYVQIIDDMKGVTLVSASTLENELQAKLKGLNKTQQAHLVGLTVAERAKTKGVKGVVFDRGGYSYIGRVKALADGAREGGLEF